MIGIFQFKNEPEEIRWLYFLHARRWISGLALPVALHQLLFYGLPGGLLLGLLIGLGVFYFRAGAVPATATTLSLSVATLLRAFSIYLLELDKGMYYRPHGRRIEVYHGNL